MLKRPRHILKTCAYPQAQIIESPGPPLFRGDRKTIKALYDFIDSVERQKDSRLTHVQSKALIKVAEALVSYIETGYSQSISDGNIMSSTSITGFKRTLTKHVPDSVRERAQSLSVLS